MMQYLAVKQVSDIADSPAHWTMTTVYDTEYEITFLRN